MKYTATLFVCIFIFLGMSARSVESRLIHVADSAYGKTSVNTAIFRASPLATYGDMQFISFYDQDGYLMLGRRNLGSTHWEMARTQYKGRVHDAHNVISMAIDCDGFLHVAFDHHGNKLNYARSQQPCSLELGPLIPMTEEGEDDVTYPEFYNLADGRLLFAFRSGASGHGNLVMNIYDPSTGCWKRLHDILIDGENERNAYWQIHVDQAGTIHLSWVWRETWNVETNHDICYARSKDNGTTWEKSDGTPLALPITESTAEYAIRVPQNSELINQTSISADADGNPYIATYWRDADSDIPQYRVVWHNGKGWRHRTVGSRDGRFTLAGGGTKMIPIARPRMVIENGIIHYLMRDLDRGGKVEIATATTDPASPWHVQSLTPFSVNAWEPSIDLSLWNSQRKLHVYVQPSMQGDGERTVDTGPQSVYVLEIETHQLP